MNEEGNNLFPVFFKLHYLEMLIVGGGNVGLEKLEAILRNSPKAKVTVVAGLIRDELKSLASDHPTVVLVERDFEMGDIEGKDLIICATDNRSLHEEIKAVAESRHIMTNVADTPDLCDFYLGSVVKKGDLKIAISTNGKSPTVAKRMREYLTEALPDSIQDVLDKMGEIRGKLKGDFAYKVNALDEVTSSWLDKGNKRPE